MGIDYSSIGIDAAVSGGAIAIYFVACFFSSIVGIALYVLNSLGLMGMLKNAGYSKPYLAWIPFANVYALGKLAEITDTNQPAKKHSTRLLVLQICIAVLSIAIVILSFSLIVTLIANGFDTENIVDLASFATISIVIIPIGIAVSVMSVIYMVFYYIADWKIYSAFMPDYAIGFILLAIFVGGSEPIIRFCIRLKKPKLPGNGTTGTPFNGGATYYAPNQAGQNGPQNPYNYQ